MDAIKYQHPEMLYLLLLVLPLLLLLWFKKRQDGKRWQNLGNPEVFRSFVHGRSPKIRFWKAFLSIFVFTTATYALANLQSGAKVEEVEREGIDLIFALDLSNSMLSEDVSPSRLEAAKRLMKRVMSKRPSDQVAIVVFAGNAYVQMPLTSDHSASKLFVDALNTDVIPSQGTAIGAAVKKSVQLFNESSDRNRCIVLISDGENHEGDALKEAQKAAQEHDVFIQTVGVGSKEGGPIPVYDRNGVRTDFRRNRAGEIVITKLNEDMMQSIADVGNGRYFRLANRDILPELNEAIDSIEKTKIDTVTFTDYESHFQYFLAFAVLGLLIHLLLPDSGWNFKNKWLK